MRRLCMPYWHYCAADGFVPYSHLHRLMDEGASQAGIACFGTRVMECRPDPTWAGLAPELVTQPTIYLMLKAFGRGIHRYGTSKRWWLADTSDNVWLCRGGPPVCEVGEEQMTLYALTGAIQIIRIATGPSWKPETIFFQGEPPPGMNESELYSSTWIQTGYGFSAVAVPRALLGRTLPTPAHNGIARRDKRKPSFGSAPASDFSGALRQVIGTYLTERCLRINEIAEMTGYNVRTLQRRLETEGKTYSQLVDQARFDAAARLLRKTDSKIIDIAYDVGYAHPTHFTRAFRRVAGVSPSEYRLQAHLR